MPWTRPIATVALTLLLAGPTAAQQMVPPQAPLGSRGPAIIGTVVDAGKTMPEASVQLRNTASGRIVSRTVADDTGEFRFPAVAPGSYVLELIDERDRVVAYGDIFDLAPAQTLVTVFETSDETPRKPRGATVEDTGRRRALWLTSAAAVAGVVVFGLTGR